MTAAWSVKRERVDFAAVNVRALCNLPAILERWLPGGRLQGAEYVVRNPRRDDRRPGSFKINTRTGRWCDFATGDRGGDLIALCSYLFDLQPLEAARRLREMLGG